MYCKNCGEKINKNAQFCEHCGFNQNEEVDYNQQQYNMQQPISWYQLGKADQKQLKREFKSIYPGNSGLEALAVICFIIGCITALYTFGSYSIKVLDSTVASGTFISVPMLIITICLFVGGLIAGYSSNHKFDKAFSGWLSSTYNIIK